MKPGDLVFKNPLIFKGQWLIIETQTGASVITMTSLRKEVREDDTSAMLWQEPVPICVKGILGGEEVLISHLSEWEQIYGDEYQEMLLRAAHEQCGKRCVVLVDEYDEADGAYSVI